MKTLPPRHVARHQIRRELDPLVGAAEHLGQHAHEERLAEPRHAFDQHVPAGKDGDERVLDHFVLPQQHAPDLGADLVAGFTEFCRIHNVPPISLIKRPRSRTRARSSPGEPMPARDSAAPCASNSNRITAVSSRPLRRATCWARPCRPAGRRRSGSDRASCPGPTPRRRPRHVPWRGPCCSAGSSPRRAARTSGAKAGSDPARRPNRTAAPQVQGEDQQQELHDGWGQVRAPDRLERVVGPGARPTRR